MVKKVKSKKVSAKRQGVKSAKNQSHPREVLYAPWRYSYIKGTLKKPQGCVFCEALKKGVNEESLIVHEAKTCFVILNKYPYNNGHILVLPKKHTDDLNALSNEEFIELHEVLKRAVNAVETAYQPQGMNLGMNFGRTGGAGIVDHLHYHIVPRWNGDTNFMPIVGMTKVISESLSQTYKKLLPLFT